MKNTLSCCSLFFLLGLFWVGALPAQPNAAGGSRIGKWDNQVFLSDVQGRPIRSQYRDVNGTPYFRDSFLTAAVVMRNGRSFPEVRMKLDVVSQELLFKSPSGEEGIMKPDFLTEVRFLDSTQEGFPLVIVRTGYPEVELRQPNEFYQVLSDGKAQLVKAISKYIDSRKNEISGEVFKEFAAHEDYYVFTEGRFFRLKKDKTAVLAALNAQYGKMVDWVGKNKGSFKNEAYLSKLFDHFNSL